MAIENRTPYESFDSITLTPRGSLRRFCVVRGTFRVTGGESLELAEEQIPVVLQDEYRGLPTQSSLRVENDLAPWKPRGELYFVNPIARAPSGAPEHSWEVHVSMADVSVSMRVVGERTWYKTSFGRWQLTQPKVCHEIEVSYERAFGGTCPADPIDVVAENPVGRGCYPVSGSDEVAAPQIEGLDEETLPPGAGGRTIGLTPVHRGWMPRRLLAGTFDQAWRERKWPLAPDDFDYAFYNCAPPILQSASYFRGDEWVHVRGIGPVSDVRFRLPESRKPLLLMLTRGGIVHVATFALDTVILDLEAGLLSLLWRSMFAPPEQTVNERLLLAEG